MADSRPPEFTLAQRRKIGKNTSQYDISHIAVRYIYADLLRSWALLAIVSTGQAEFGLP